MRRIVLAGVIGIAILGAVAGAWAQGESRRPSEGPGMMGPGMGMMGQGMMGMGLGQPGMQGMPGMMMGGEWAQQMQQMMSACTVWMGAQQPQGPAPQPPSR